MKRHAESGSIWYKRYNMSFDEKGFKKNGFTEIPSPDEMAKIASTSSPVVEKLAEIGTELGKFQISNDDFPDRKESIDC